ncbi:MAG: hypothetical protein ACHQF2_01155 [Flavobacteriales bacterium]
MQAILSPFTIIKSVSNEWATIHLCSDGVMEIHFGDLQYNVEMAKKITNLCGEVCGGQKVLVLGVASEYSDVDTDARNFMSTPEALRYSLAEAFVLKSLSQRILGNFYLKFQRPSVPTRLFSSAVEARVWLLEAIEKK